jgi:hypothetical protein
MPQARRPLIEAQERDSFVESDFPLKERSSAVAADVCLAGHSSNSWAFLTGCILRAPIVCRYGLQPVYPIVIVVRNYHTNLLLVLLVSNQLNAT